MIWVSLMRGQTHDAIVIGAGPAGATAARQCALRGLDTLLLEKEAFPRYKPCAGAVSQWALSTLDFELPTDIIEEELFGSRLFFKGRSAEANKPFRIAVLVSREEFDCFLLERAKEAGVHVRLSTAARDYRIGPEHVEVVTDNGSFRGQCMVIAEGALGGMARRIRGPYGKNGAAIAMVTEIESPPDEIERRTDRKVHLYLDVAHRGYGWIFPHRRYYSIGVGGIRSRISNPGDRLRQFLARHGFARTQRLRGHLVPIGGIRRKVVDRRAILVGDAAGFVDSFVGEGIGYAILSGKLAAETIHTTLSEGKPPEVDLNPYQELCEKRFGARLRYSKHLARILHSLPEVFLRTFASQPEVVERFLDLAVWRISYREALIWFLARLPKYLLLG
jgi:geranylgeranyl reductase family protein